MKIIGTTKLIVKSWCNKPEQGAVEQAQHLAELPFAFHHVSLMPDTHQGYGMPIGGVLATIGAIIPNAVGVDIGCGMLAAKTALTAISQDEVRKLLSRINAEIPSGFNHRTAPLEIEAPLPEAVIGNQQYEAARLQLGTLGGGNHFIEIQQGNDGHIWYMIHSGSRNLGKKACDYHNAIAKKLNKQWHTAVPESWDLAFLPADSAEGNAYIADMQYCQNFAFQNRNEMAERIEKIMQHMFPSLANESAPQRINAHHNYARLEHHFGKNVWIHRKGATSAAEGELGIIPGSQGTKSYIVKGKGNRESFMSCSHGAGRRMGRKEAQRTLSLDEEIKRMDNAGIVHSIKVIADLDEAAGAYKDIDVVMQEQADLVDIAVELLPLGVIKA